MELRNKEQTDVYTRGWRVEEMGRCWPKVQTFSYKTNKFQGYNIQHGDYS